ncbi:Shedu anti-phage system protein SduA domain-containing protein [Phyllobacterium chamaecytisi]|uniref:Shedu anti-phage system protein SduA domain-containing protein n=1 Tax=Phyllobacterium chamaecytisi TaxID=2876082 RepID=UPI001CCC460A|nr:Shedu anti-phage system protein SduA domain-containing protein [Phyllobacterium sp. KW56]MBZ9603181.1 DUF4263 domain-containing protein [Phyllobacterium sp. KW56]
MAKSPCRGTDVFNPSAESSGAVYQILDQCNKLHSHLPDLKDESGRYDLHAQAVQCIVIAGKSPTEIHLIKSFEILRSSFTYVTIITFDELCARLTEIHKALSPPLRKKKPMP